MSAGWAVVIRTHLDVQGIVVRCAVWASPIKVAGGSPRPQETSVSWTPPLRAVPAGVIAAGDSEESGEVSALDTPQHFDRVVKRRSRCEHEVRPRGGRLLSRAQEEGSGNHGDMQLGSTQQCPISDPIIIDALQSKP